MAAKLLHTLADENPDLQKQIGCMTGIFQLFDRHQVLTGRRTNHKRITLGSSHISSINFERESINVFNQQRATEMNLNRSVNDKQRLSMESSRLSFSSSCSSSLSSSEFNKGAQAETSAFDRMIFPETPMRDPITNEATIFPQLGAQPVDLRDVVRDSMYREARGLSIKTNAKGDVTRRAKREDTPRPYSSGKVGKQNVHDDLKESLRVLAKLQEAPQYYNEAMDSKERPWNTLPKDAPRFSADSRETVKSAQKLKELPRLSLDSREHVMWGSTSDSKAGLCSGSSSNKVPNLPQSSSVSQKRPPSVVAKLMGLEALPGSPLASEKHQLGILKSPFEDGGDPFLKSLRVNSFSRPMRSSPSSPRSSIKDPTSPRWKNTDFVMKPISSARVPIEPAPWKQLDKSRVAQKQTASRPVVKAASRIPNSMPSVYSEIEKRLKDLEFKHSGKDLRALKQIMEAMQSKGYLETQKEEQSLNFGSRRDFEQKSTMSNQNTRGPRSNVTSSSARGPSSSSRETFESPIVIIKPAKLVEKTGIPASSLIPIHSLKLPSQGPEDNSKRSLTSSRTAKERSPRNRQKDSSVNSTDKRTSTRNAQYSSTKPQQFPKESTSTSTSPRLQKKKLEFDKRSRPPTPPSDTSKPRRQANRQLTESTSPGGKLRPKLNSQQNYEHLSQVSNESRTSSHPGDDACLQSDAEVTSAELPVEFNGIESPSITEAAKCIVSSLMQKTSSPRLSEDGSSANLSILAPEHPSPISVLDTSVYQEVASSPVKQIEDNDEGTVSLEPTNDHSEDQWNPTYSFSENTASGFSSEVSRKKLQNVEHLVQKLRRLNSTHDEASQDYIASLCENTNPNSDHRYISEILLASGLLLRDLGSGLTTFQLHPSGHPINPELFLVLEQTKGNSDNSLLYKEECKVSTYEKLQRKLVFDTVNEILVEKLASVGATADPLVKAGKTTKKTLSAQQLLKELCSEIEQLQLQGKRRLENFVLEEEEDYLKGVLWEDVMFRSGNWTDFNGEVPGVVLDVERLVFKDLVDEIVHGEAAGLRTKTGRRRTLFMNQ